MKNNLLVIYGGGIDSTTLLAHYTKTHTGVVALHFDYGQKAARLEKASGEHFCAIYGAEFKTIVFGESVLSGSDLLKGAIGDASTPVMNVVEGRNLLFISAAAAIASAMGIRELAVGFHLEPEGAPFPDASAAFLDAVNATLKAGMINHTTVLAPFRNMSRLDIFKYADTLDPAIVKSAHTCYADVEGGCGVCSHCKTKAQLLQEMGG